MEEFFTNLPLSVNLLFIFVSLLIVIRSAHYLVDGAIHVAHEFNVSPLVIGATVVAMGTTSAENAVNLVIVLSGGDTSAVVGNILGSNMVNFGVELGVSILIAGLIFVPEGVLQKDMPLYFATAGLLSVFVMDGEISRTDGVILIIVFVASLGLRIQSALKRSEGSVLLVEVTEIEAISHPSAAKMTRRQALVALFGGIFVLILASRLMILNTSSLALAFGIPEYIVGLIIIGPGTSLPEIVSSIQAARRNHADLVLGTAFGSCLFNLTLGLGLPAIVKPLTTGSIAMQGFTFINIVNISLLTLVIADHPWVGKTRTMSRTLGIFLLTTYSGFILYQVVNAAGGTMEDLLSIFGVATFIVIGLLASRKWLGGAIASLFKHAPLDDARPRILCATRGGEASQPTHLKAIEIAREQNAELLFLYVFDKSILQKIATPILINVEAQIDHMLSYLQNTAQEQARQAGVHARIVVRTGNVFEQIIAVGEEESVTQIILGTPSGRTSTFEREAIISFANKIEKSTGIPVLKIGGEKIGLN
jgi:cation:H+ antiporter